MLDHFKGKKKSFASAFGYQFMWFQAIPLTHIIYTNDPGTVTEV